MTAEDHKQRISRAIEAFNRGDRAGYLSAYSRECVLHGFPPPVEPTYRGLEAFLDQFMTALPDVQVIPDDVIVEGDRMAVRYRIRGTHKGELFGSLPTGRTIEFEAMTILRFDAAGRIAERWQRSDDVALLTQLGPLPAAVQA